MSESPAAPTHTDRPAAGSVVGADRVLGDRYRILGRSEGGWGFDVYEAEDSDSGSLVTVTCVDADLLDDAEFLIRFDSELRRAAVLDHPNVSTVHDWGVDPVPFVVGDPTTGASLGDLCSRGRLSPSQGLIVALQAAQALEHAHDHGVAHRAVSPANLILDTDSRLRVANFGLAAVVAEIMWSDPSRTPVSTVRHAAPEQALSDAHGEQSDLYSLVLTIAEAVTGTVPLLRGTALATMVLRQDHDVGVLAELGPLGEALASAGRADPEARPSAADLIHALTAAARSLPRPEPLPIVSEPTHDSLPEPLSESPPEAAAPASREANPKRVVDLRRESARGLAPVEGLLKATPIRRPGSGDWEPTDRRARESEAHVASGFLTKPDQTRTEPVADDEHDVMTFGVIDLDLDERPEPPPEPTLAPEPPPVSTPGAASPAPSPAPSSVRSAAPSHAPQPRNGAVTRFDLPALHSDGSSAVDLRDEGRGRYGDEMPDSDHLVDLYGPQTVDPDLEGPSGDGFDDLTVGSLVVVAPDDNSQQAAGPTPAPSGEAEGARAAANEARDDRPGESAPPAVRLARVAPAGFDTVPSMRPQEQKADHFRTAFIDEQPVDNPSMVAELLRAPRTPFLVGIVAFATVAVGIAALAAYEMLATADESTSTTVLVSESVPVGNYLGLTVPEVAVEAEANGWELTVTERREDGTEAGVVTRQVPPEGALLAAGEGLVVEVSLGPELRTLPRVVGLTLAEAESVLSRANLILGVVTERHDDEIEGGRVLSARVEGVEAADQVETGTVVDLVVSAGPLAAPMPSFVGLTLDAALAQADELGLVVTTGEAPSNTYDEGFIVDTDPPTGTDVSPGDPLHLVVSTGPEQVKVPDVVGMTAVEAADLLTDAGFTVVDTDGPPNQPVVGTNPDVGTLHADGGEVVIRTTPGG